MAEQKNSFWYDAALEPKRQFRFLIGLLVNGTELQFACKTADRPSYTIGEQEHRFFNHTFYYPGRMNWNTVGMTLVDAIEPGSTELLYEYLAAIGIQEPSSHASALGTTITKQTATKALGDVRIKELGTKTEGSSPQTTEVTSVIGEWTLKNAFITEVNFGSHSYESDEMVEISLTLRYDWATYVKKAGAGGSKLLT